MKGIKEYIIEACTACKIDREDFEEKCPKFWQAVSQFCRDKNIEEGVDFLIASWIMNPDDFDKAYPNRKNDPLTSEECHKFEWDYLSDEAIEEIEKYTKK